MVTKTEFERMWNTVRESLKMVIIENNGYIIANEYVYGIGEFVTLKLNNRYIGGFPLNLISEVE
jgi:hypothetical protein